MIVAREEASRAHLATGVWGRVTLDQVLEKNAATKPDRLAVVDFSDRAAWTSGQPRRLTYAELDQKVETLAAFFAGLGLTPDSVIGVQMPPTTDAVIVMFAALRAGLVIATMPLAWREAEILEALGQVGAKAVVTVAAAHGEPLGERLRDVAGELFHIRFVFGAGGNVPDGLIDLDRVFEESASLGSAPNLVRKGNAADHAATLSWSVPPGGGLAQPIAHSHNHWIATGLMTLLEAKVDQTAVMLCPFALSGVAAIGGGMAPWLLACSTLVLGLPTSVEQLAETVVNAGATHVLTPQRFARRLAERLEIHRAEPQFLVVGSEVPIDAAMPRGVRVVDMTVFGEMGLVARQRRTPVELAPLPIGAIGAPSDTEFAPVLIEARVKALPQKAGDIAPGAVTTGELQLRGAMVPDSIWGPGARPVLIPSDGEEWISTGLSVGLVSTDPPAFENRGLVGEVISRRALGFDLRGLDDLFRSVEGISDAAAIPFPDAASQRVAAVIVPNPGVTVDPAAFIAAIEARRVGPHKVPVEVFSVPSIARSASERVMRSGMASRLAQRAPTRPA